MPLTFVLGNVADKIRMEYVVALENGDMWVMRTKYVEEDEAYVLFSLKKVNAPHPFSKKIHFAHETYTALVGSYKCKRIFFCTSVSIDNTGNVS